MLSALLKESPGVCTLLGGSSGDKVKGIRLKSEGREQMGVLIGFFTEESDEVEARGTPRVASPLGQLGVGLAAFGSKDLESGKE